MNCSPIFEVNSSKKQNKQNPQRKLTPSQMEEASKKLAAKAAKMQSRADKYKNLSAGTPVKAKAKSTTAKPRVVKSAGASPNKELKPPSTRKSVPLDAAISKQLRELKQQVAAVDKTSKKHAAVANQALEAQKNLKKQLDSLRHSKPLPRSPLISSNVTRNQRVDDGDSARVSRSNASKETRTEYDRYVEAAMRAEAESKGETFTVSKPNLASPLRATTTAAMPGVFMKNFAGRKPQRKAFKSGGTDHLVLSAFGLLEDFKVPSGTVPGEAIFRQQLNPSNWLSTEFYMEAMQFEEWKIHSLSIHIQPLVSTMTNGAFLGFFHTDPDDEEASYETLPLGYSHENARTFNVGVPSFVKYPNSKRSEWLYTDAGTSGEPRTYSAGFAIVQYMGGITDLTVLDSYLWVVGINAEIEFRGRRLKPISEVPFAEIVVGDPSAFRGRRSQMPATVSLSSFFQGATIDYQKNFGVTISPAGNVEFDLGQWFGSRFYIGMDIIVDGTDAIAQVGDIGKTTDGLTTVESETANITVDPIDAQAFSWYAIVTPVALAALASMTFGLEGVGTGVIVTAAKLLLSVLPPEVETLDEAHEVLSTRCLDADNGMLDHFRMRTTARLTGPRRLISSPGSDVPYRDAIMGGIYGYLGSNKSIAGVTSWKPFLESDYVVADYNFQLDKTSGILSFDLTSEKSSASLTCVTLLVEYWWQSAGSFNSSVGVTVTGPIEDSYNDGSPANNITRVEFHEYYSTGPDQTRFGPGHYTFDISINNLLVVPNTRTLIIANVEMIMWGGDGIARATLGSHPSYQMYRKKVEAKIGGAKKACLSYIPNEPEYSNALVANVFSQNAGSWDIPAGQDLLLSNFEEITSYGIKTTLSEAGVNFELTDSQSTQQLKQIVLSITWRAIYGGGVTTGGASASSEPSGQITTHSGINYYSNDGITTFGSYVKVLTSNEAGGFKPGLYHIAPRISVTGTDAHIYKVAWSIAFYPHDVAFDGIDHMVAERRRSVELSSLKNNHKSSPTFLRN